MATSTLHQERTKEDVEAGRAQIVSCPECGQQELWSIEETKDHGLCRTKGEECIVCPPSDMSFPSDRPATNAQRS